MAVLTVGQGSSFARIADAVAAARDGDTVLVAAGTYTNDFAQIRTKITLQSVGGMVNLVATVAPPNGKAILDVYTDAVIDGFGFFGAKVPDHNGAGIRGNAGNLTIRNSLFMDNENGILIAPDATATVLIQQSEFAHNGGGDGYTHNLYVGAVKQLTIENSYFHDAVVGHEIKSRALSTTITNSRIVDGAGNASYSIDLPEGGTVLLQGNVIEKGAQAPNQTIIHFGGEGAAYAGSSLVMTGNTVVNDRAGAVGLTNAAGAAVTVTGNQFFGVTAASFGGTAADNVALGARPAIDATSIVPADLPSIAPPPPVLLSTPVPDGLAYVTFGRAGAVQATGHVLQVGAARAFTTLQQALAASRDGDTIRVDAGTYTDDFGTANHAVIIEGVGGMARFVATQKPENGRGILVANASITVRNLEFTGARSWDGNGAGIRADGGDLTVVNCYFHDNDVSILATHADTASIFDTEIAQNGNWDKETHNLNIGAINSFTLENSYVHDGHVAHEVNSQAIFNRILNNRIIDGDWSHASFGISLGHGGDGVIRGNVIQKGPDSANGVLVHVGGEGPAYTNTNVVVDHNTLISDYQNPDHPYTYFIYGDAGGSGAVPRVLATNNVFVGGVPGSEQARGESNTGAVAASSAVIDRTAPWSAPAAVANDPTPAGSDNLVIRLSNIARFAPAEFIVTVDGEAVGGGQVTAERDYAFSGQWGAGPHTVSVTEVNGRYGISLEGGRSWVTALTLDGTAVDGAHEITWSPFTTTIDVPAPSVAQRALAAPADPGVDAAWYAAQHPGTGDASAAYHNGGWQQGTNPNAWFDTNFYLTHNPDVAAAGVDPLLHYETSGWHEGRDPSAQFSTNGYLAANPDVQAAGVDPLLHYLVHGKSEGRALFVARPEPSAEALLFDGTYYLQHNPDVAAARVDPLLHYEHNGWIEGRDPSAGFSTAKYLVAYADVRAAGMDPLAHFASFGSMEGRSAFPV